jgi:hypothetical protein
MIGDLFYVLLLAAVFIAGELVLRRYLKRRYGPRQD